MNADLLDYAVGYFGKVAQSIFDDYMKNLGFKFDSINEYGEVTYSKGSLFFHVGYYPETAPDYALQILAGLSDDSLEGISSLATHIHLSQALPEDKDRGYEFWAFSNESELSKKLIFIRDKIIEVYLNPLWNDSRKLSHLIEIEYAKYLKKSRLDELEKKRERSAAAFRSKDYSLAVNILESIKHEYLSELDKKRLQIAKKLLGRKT